MTNEERMVLIKKNPISVGCGALAVLLIAALYFRADEIPAAEAELVQKSGEAERYALNLKNATQLKEQLEDVAASNKIIESRMMRVSQLGNNTSYFLKLFADTGVKQIDFGQGTTIANMPKAAKTAFIPVAFRVSVSGTLPQVMNFLRNLEEGTHYCRVLTAQLSGPAANRNTPLILSLNLELLGLP